MRFFKSRGTKSNGNNPPNGNAAHNANTSGVATVRKISVARCIDVMPSKFPRKGRGVGPGGRGGLHWCAGVSDRGPRNFRAYAMASSTAASPRATIMVQAGRSEPSSEQEAVHFWYSPVANWSAADIRINDETWPFFPRITNTGHLQLPRR